MKAFATLLLFLIFGTIALCQPSVGKQLTIEDLATWKQIQNPLISNDGQWVAYSLKGEIGDAVLYVWNAASGKTYSFARGENADFSADSRLLYFKIKPLQDTIKAQKRRQWKEDKLTRDSMGILELNTQKLTKIADVKALAVPEKWSDWILYQKEAEKPDTTGNAAAKAKGEPKDKKKTKKEGKDTGYKVVARNTRSGEEATIPFVTDYLLAREGGRALAVSTGDDSLFLPGVYVFDAVQPQWKPLFRKKGTYKQLCFEEKGGQAAFLANFDTAKAQAPAFSLFYWSTDQDSAQWIADSSSQFLPARWMLSENRQPQFSKDGAKLYFGIAPPPVLRDTSLLEEEIVNVEVWSFTDGVLHTQQEVLADKERKRAYDAVWNLATGDFATLSDEAMSEMAYAPDRNAATAIGYDEKPYQQAASWEGRVRKDVYQVDVNTGERKPVMKGLAGNPRVSPQAKYAYWYNERDTLWQAFEMRTGDLRRLTNNRVHPFYDELNDSPDYPDDYGMAAWTEDDRYILIYDRYDIWQIDPEGKEAPVNLTNGRDARLVYRYIALDREERFIRKGQRMLLHVFNEKDKSSGYAHMTWGESKPSILAMEPLQYTRGVRKAKEADRVVFTKENFQTFPDLLYSDLTFQKPKRVSNANPRQSQYAWGSIELYEWTALDGQRLQGLLVKPAGFDPKRQYPMLVNFYERNSDRLHDHPAPYPHRSTINYAYYASRGYIIFNPDIPYRIGYPGESCLNSVVPGVTSLIEKGFIDKDRIGVQGHSWGGYQVAYLLTKTDIFKCAESGAPVVNMFSAYGGIRWETGLSRMFQYEHSQSRIGGTPWEYPLRYQENSPLFSMDKVNTPVLIMSNDHDGHVPWYQGIEYFTALRRLGKPSWLLNYNGEPHWPLKLQNRMDFQTRMSQFFDYYLKDAPKPMWMERGVPAVEKGILQGLEVITDE